MSIGTNIRNKRLKNGWSQDELGSKLLSKTQEQISGKTISSWESGRTEPSIGLIEQMCELFHCTKSDLIGPDKFADVEIAIIQRERSKMSDKEKAKLMNILKANFDEYNWEEDDSGNID